LEKADIEHVLSTFPIAARRETSAHATILKLHAEMSESG
jgi:hypothetical protein